MSEPAATVAPSRRPFEQLPFSELPELPRRAHVYERAEALDLSLASTLFGDMRVHVRRLGSGPPLLLVHGLMTTSYSWRYALGPLGEHFSCFAVDLPGAGRTSTPRGVLAPEAIADWIVEVMAALDIEGAAVIGNSMGGYLCMQSALRHPGTMSRLINLHSPGIPELRIDALAVALRTPGGPALLRWLVNRDPLRWAHRNVHYYDETLKSLEEARTYGEPLRGAGADVLVRYLRDTLRPSSMRTFGAQLRARRARGEPFVVPLQLIYARRDPMVPPRFGDVYHQLVPSAELVWLEHASHFAHVDALESFAGAALPFLLRAQQAAEHTHQQEALPPEPGSWHDSFVRIASLSLLLLVLPGSVAATQIQNWPLERVLADAGAVVIGEIVAQHSLRQGDQILTESVVRVEQDLLGSGRFELTVTQLGGTYGGRVAEVVGDVRLAVGQRVLLMTRRHTDGRWYIVGMALGAYFADGAGFRQRIDLPLVGPGGGVGRVPTERRLDLATLQAAIARRR